MFASGWWLAFAGWGSFPTKSLYCVSKSCFLFDYMLFLTFWVCLTRPVPLETLLRGLSPGLGANILTSSPIITANWLAASNDRWTLPIGGGVGKLFKLGKLPSAKMILFPFCLRHRN